MNAEEHRPIFCTQCKEEVMDRPIRQDNELFCSVQCADKASGHDTEEPEEYYDESDLEGLYEEE